MGAHIFLGGAAGLAGCWQVQCGEWDENAGFPRPIRPSRMNASQAAVGPSLNRARLAALRLLSYRARSTAEVRRRLEMRYPSAVIEQVLERLAGQGYLDDAAFAREWRRSREEHRPRSRRALEQELLRFGVEREIVEDALADFDDAGNAYRAALRPAQRLDGNDYPAFRTRVWRYLQRRGFEASVIAEVVGRLWRELADPHHRAVDPQTQEQQREKGQFDRADAPGDDEGQGHGTGGNPGQALAPFAVDRQAD